MKTHYRKIPPYMTKTGVQIGLLYQEPFEKRMDEDGFALQRALLAQKYKSVNNPYKNIDMVIVAISIVGILIIILGGIYGLL